MKAEELAALETITSMNQLDEFIAKAEPDDYVDWIACAVWCADWCDKHYCHLHAVAEGVDRYKVKE